MLALALILAITPVTPGLVPGDYCDATGERTAWTRERRRQTYHRADAVAVALRVTPIIAAYHNLIIERESHGVASVEHVQGRDRDGTPERGLGAYGLSMRWHDSKISSGGEPGFCTPEVSAVVAHEIMHRAWHSFGARTVLELQAVYAGAWDCSGNRCIFTLSVRQRRGLCDRMRERGYDCEQPLELRDLGRRLAPDERLPWALARARAWLTDSGWLSR